MTPQNSLACSLYLSLSSLSDLLTDQQTQTNTDMPSCIPIHGRSIVTARSVEFRIHPHWKIAHEWLCRPKRLFLSLVGTFSPFHLRIVMCFWCASVLVANFEKQLFGRGCDPEDNEADGNSHQSDSGRDDDATENNNSNNNSKGKGWRNSMQNNTTIRMTKWKQKGIKKRTKKKQQRNCSAFVISSGEQMECKMAWHRNGMHQNTDWHTYIWINFNSCPFVESLYFWANGVNEILLSFLSSE